MPDFYLGTVLLEKNRWQSRVPSLRVSEWVGRMAADGFCGIELWENHVLRMEGEAEALQKAMPPVAVYNMYADFSDESKPGMEQSAAMIQRLQPKGVKFNLGEDAARLPEYRKNMLAFAEALPAGCVMLCEVHQGTVLEEIDAAAAFFKDLPAEKFQIITHAFSSSAADLQRQFDAFGGRISLVHVQYVLDGKRVRLDRNPAFAKECLQVLAANGYKGGFTMEFTEGTAEPGENIEDLYANAILDMQFIKQNIQKHKEARQ